jgi:hypothetical protein
VLRDLIRKEPTRIDSEYLNGSGFIVTFRYVSNPEIEQMSAQIRAEIKDGRIINPYTTGMRMAVANGIVDWKGLTKDVLLKMDIDFDEDALLLLDKEISCTPDDKAWLLEQDAQFNDWCQSIAYDIGKMREIKARAEEKNSLTL